MLKYASTSVDVRTRPLVPLPLGHPDFTINSLAGRSSAGEINGNFHFWPDAKEAGKLKHIIAPSLFNGFGGTPEVMVAPGPIPIYFSCFAHRRVHDSWRIHAAPSRLIEGGALPSVSVLSFPDPCEFPFNSPTDGHVLGVISVPKGVECDRYLRKQTCA